MSDSGTEIAAAPDDSELDAASVAAFAPQRAMATLRAANAERVVAVAETLVGAGLTSIELTLSTPRILDRLAEIRDCCPTAVVGVGTVVGRSQALDAIAAGATFLVTPIGDLDVLDAGTEHGLPVLVGAFTPTEAWAAQQRGAAAVKAFPVRALGPRFVSDLLGPLPSLRIVATGGVSIESSIGYLAAGAVAVGLGGELVGDALRGGDLGALAGRAEDLLARIGGARSPSTQPG